MIDEKFCLCGRKLHESIKEEPNLLLCAFCNFNTRIKYESYPRSIVKYYQVILFPYMITQYFDLPALYIDNLSDGYRQEYYSYDKIDLDYKSKNILNKIKTLITFK